jgi:putative spermidine/putrescine transport system substrate-binding protein
MMRSHRKAAGTALGVIGLMALTLPAEANSITVVSGGGAYAHSQIEAFHKPFSEETGITVNSADYNYDLGPIRAQVEAGNVHWDVAVVEEHMAIRGCAEGLFEPIDPATLPKAPDGAAADDDYMGGTLHECAAGEVIWSLVFAYDQRQFPDNAGPQSLADFFNPEEFPGTRGLQNKAQGNLEFALMADGVPPEEVYDVLSTEEGMSRAFAVLDRIKDDAVWWETGAQSVQILADGEVAMSTTWNGRIQAAIDQDNLPITIVWDGQNWNLDMWAILKGTPNLEAALQFVEFAARPDRMADQTNYIAYSPVRQSAYDLVPDEIARTLPTHPDNFATALKFSAEWWADHGDRTEERYTTWLAR